MSVIVSNLIIREDPYTWGELADVPWASAKPWTHWAPYEYDIGAYSYFSSDIVTTSNFWIQTVVNLDLSFYNRSVSEIQQSTQIALSFAETSKITMSWFGKTNVSMYLNNTIPTGITNTVHSAFSCSILAPVGAKTVLYDLQFYDHALTSTELLTEAKEIAPLDYSRVRVLTPGDYSWSQAIVGLQISAPPNGSRVGFSGFDLYMDVPDTVERNTVDLAAELTSIEFNKLFYSTPEVYANFIQGTTLAVPRVTAITRYGFTIGLYSVENPATLVAGKVSYLVQGY